MLNPKVAVPVVIDDAIRAEAERTGLRRHQVLEDWFVRTWPDYVSRNLRRDLGAAAGCIDVAAGPATSASERLPIERQDPTRTQNGTPESKLRGANDELDSTPIVELNSTARRLTEGASSAVTP
ncbi:MAG: hypothetical protein ACLPQS_04180 [Acidimicrobiales bacterium]